MSTPEFDELLKITDWRKRRGRLLTCTVCAAVVSHDDLILHREWHRKIDTKFSAALGRINEPQPFTVKKFEDAWGRACEDAYSVGHEPTVTLPVDVFPYVNFVQNEITGRRTPVARFPMFSWPKVRAERGMVVDS